MTNNKILKNILFTFIIGINLFNFSIEKSYAYPVFAQQGYSNPRAANGKLACANCHLNQKAIEIEAPQAVLPNSIFEVEVKLDEKTLKQIAKITGGKYFNATNKNLMEEVYNQINRLEAIDNEERTFFIKKQLYHIPLSAAMFLLLIIATIPLIRHE